MRHDTAELIVILRKTLEDVQDSVRRESAAVQEMKRSILRTIAELRAELRKEDSERHDVKRKHHR